MPLDKIEVPLIPECSSCIVNSLGTMIPLLTSDPKKQFELFSLAFRRISQGYEDRTTPHALSLELYRELYAKMRTNDPYAEIKRKSIAAARAVLPSVERIVEQMSGYEKLRAAIAASITGNLIDYNTAAYQPNLDELENDFRKIMKAGFAPDDTALMWESIGRRSGRLVFLADNAGETMFDTLVVKVFLEHGWDCTFVVKDKPMINDATLEDIKGTEIMELAETITTGARAHGVPRKYMSKRFLDAVSKAHLVISKGQANIETFPQIQKESGVETYFVTRAKCPHIAESIRAPVGSNIVLRWPRPK